MTTHTEFHLRHQYASSMEVGVEQAARKAAPLSSVLVSAADYVFDLSALHMQTGNEIRLASMTALGVDPPSGHLLWDRQRLRLGARQHDIEPTFEKSR